MNILQTPRFKKQIKKLHKNQKRDLNTAIETIIKNPEIGDLKKGDLNDIRVYKFKMAKHLTLLAYEFYMDRLQLVILSVGSHENFYRDLKR